MGEARREPVVLLAVAADGALVGAQKLTVQSEWPQWTSLGAQVDGPVAAARNLDGEIQLFATASNGQLGYVRWAESIGSGRTAWAELPAAVQFAPAVHTGDDGRLEVFATGQDGRLGHIWQEFRANGGVEWSLWDSFEVATACSPSVSRDSDGRLVVFSIGPDGCLGHVWQRLEPGGRHEWSPWESLAVPVRKRPIVVRDADGCLGVFALGLDRTLGCLQQRLDPGGVGQWSNWTSLGIEATHPAAVAWGANDELHVFVTDPEGHLLHITRSAAPGDTGEWSDAVALRADIRGAPSVVRHGDGCLEVVAVRGDGQLCHLRQRRPTPDAPWMQAMTSGPVLAEHPPTFHPNRAADAQGLGVARRPPLPAREARSSSSSSTVSVDVCVIGAGPAGITLTERLLEAGRTVMLVDSGSWNEDAEAQELNHGDGDGEIIKGDLKYLRFGRRRQVQGSASAWGRGWCLPFAGIDLAPRAWLPLSGWPMRREDLVPHELRATHTLGIEPFGPPRSEGGLQRVTYHFPRNPLVFRAILAALVEQPGLRLELETTATELVFDLGRVTGARLARLDGAEVHVAAQTVILACGGVENARILMVHESVLPVGLPMLGRCFMDHPHVLAGTVDFPAPQSRELLRRTARRQEALALPDAVQDREHVLNATAQILPGRADPDRLPSECDLFLRVEQAPNPDSRVTLAAQVDAFGWRRPYLQWRLRDDDWISIVHTAELIAGRLEQLNGPRVRLTISRDRPWPEHPVGPGYDGEGAWGNHHMGTTRMADDQADGVVDPNCRVHGTDNLYVAGSSIFPTGGAANPTFMLVALAHRLADHLAATAP